MSLGALRAVTECFATAFEDVVKRFCCDSFALKGGHGLRAIEAITVANSAPATSCTVRVYGWDPVLERCRTVMLYSRAKASRMPPLFPGVEACTASTDGTIASTSSDSSSEEEDDDDDDDADDDSSDAVVVKRLGAVDVVASKLLAIEQAVEAAIAVLRIQRVIDTKRE